MLKLYHGQSMGPEHRTLNSAINSTANVLTGLGMLFSQENITISFIKHFEIHCCIKLKTSTQDITPLRHPKCHDVDDQGYVHTSTAPRCSYTVSGTSTQPGQFRGVNPQPYTCCKETICFPSSEARPSTHGGRAAHLGMASEVLLCAQALATEETHKSALDRVHRHKVPG